MTPLEILTSTIEGSKSKNDAITVCNTILTSLEEVILSELQATLNLASTLSRDEQIVINNNIVYLTSLMCSIRVSQRSLNDSLEIMSEFLEFNNQNANPSNKKDTNSVDIDTTVSTTMVQ